MSESNVCVGWDALGRDDRPVPVPARGAGTTASSLPNDQPFPLVPGSPTLGRWSRVLPDASSTRTITSSFSTSGSDVAGR